MEDAAIKVQLFNIYKTTGADTDGDETFHCTVEEAFYWTMQAVGELRQDYDDCLKELP